VARGRGEERLVIIKNRLTRLEAKAEDYYSTLSLPDGTDICYAGEDMLDATIAPIRQREHWLLPYVRRMDTREGMAGLIRALESSRGG
jgi:hypothetical protein